MQQQQQQQRQVAAVPEGYLASVDVRYRSLAVCNDASLEIQYSIYRREG